MRLFLTERDQAGGGDLTEISRDISQLQTFNTDITASCGSTKNNILTLIVIDKGRYRLT